MYDKDIACHILKQVQHSVEIISNRFQPVKVVADFTDSPSGMEKFDSICMLLITIGENLKNFGDSGDMNRIVFLIRYRVPGIPTTICASGDRVEKSKRSS